MHLTRLKIKNFRSIKSLDIELRPTTVFIGPNNAGKTAILDALRIALTRRWGQRGTGFTEYDVHLEHDGVDPKKAPGVEIEVEAEESTPDEWPDAVQQDLGEIVQIDPNTGRRSVTLQVLFRWEPRTSRFEPRWSFLNLQREPTSPHGGKGARRVNLEKFWRYVPTFYLGALRDASDEFGSRSQFWRRLLRSVDIPPGLEDEVHQDLERVNQKLIGADPKLEQVSRTLAEATKIAVRHQSGEAGLDIVPMKSWDLLSKAGIVLRNREGSPLLPIRRHGQGVQSLSVIFLFKAFVDHLLKDHYVAESEPVLALEEPETHLHPQAARSLWRRVRELPGQKILTTHSPYFVQYVPFRDLRLVRLADGPHQASGQDQGGRDDHEGTVVRSLPASFSTEIDHANGLEKVVANSRGLLEYSPSTRKLTANGVLKQSTYRELLKCYPDRAKDREKLRDLRDRSVDHMGDDELQSLETWARRVRGEVFFADQWLIVEGQADYLIMHAMARALDYDLDEHGTALIDAQNNGDPAVFAALARALRIPWFAVFDGDEAGKKYIRRIENRGFSEADMARCRTHEAGDLEAQLIHDGLGKELKSIAVVVDPRASKKLTDDASLQEWLGDNKVRYASELANKILTSPSLVPRLPTTFRDALDNIRRLQ